MKDSSQYSKKVQKLYRSLKRKPAKPPKTTFEGRQAAVEYDEPVDALVYAVVSGNLTEAQAQKAITKLKDYFIDYNDLRVASIDEIAEVLGPDVATARGTAAALVSSLKAAFEKYNMLSLQALKKLGKRPAKQVLEKLTGATPFVVDYIMLTALQGHAIPLNSKMIEYFKTNELVHAEADYEEIEGFLTRQIPAKNAYEFYSLFRHESESTKKRRIQKKKRPH
jgi:endonuclease III